MIILEEEDATGIETKIQDLNSEGSEILDWADVGEVARLAQEDCTDCD